MSEYSYSQNDSDFTYSSKAPKADPNVKEQLFQILLEKGVIEKLKTQTRQNLISEMAAKESIFKIKSKGSEHRKEIDIFQHVSLSIISEYLRSQNLPYSLSVFIPETGVNGDKFYDIGEILRILQIDTETDFFRKLKFMLESSNKGFLWSLIKSVSECHSLSRKEIHIQTEKAERFVPMSEKMQKLDSQFEDRQKEGVLKTQQIFEDRMISYQRELERRLRQEMDNEIQRFKSHEIAMLKMKEEENSSINIKQKMKSLEEEYNNRLVALKDRERSSQENVQRLLESQERENYLQRQQLIRDINNVRERELQNKKERDRVDREFEMMKDQYKRKHDDLEKRKSKLCESEMGFDLRIEQEFNSIRLNEESRLVHKWKEIEINEAKLKDDSRQLISEKDMNEKLKQELQRKQSLFNEMEIISYPGLRDQNKTLQDQIKELKQQLEQQIVINGQDKHKIDCLIKQNMGPNFEQQVLTNELDRARDIFKREKSLLEEQKESLEKKLIDEIRNKRLLTEQYSQQQEVNEIMSRQLGEFKDTSLRSRYGYQSSRTHGNERPSARLNTNRDLSPHSNSEIRRKSNVNDDDCSCPNDGFDFAFDAKHRLSCLDEETEQINKTYQQFKNRLANSSSQIGEIQTKMPVGLVSESFKSGLQEGRLLNKTNSFDFHIPVFSKHDKDYGYIKKTDTSFGNSGIPLDTPINTHIENDVSKILSQSFKQRSSPNLSKLYIHREDDIVQSDASDNTMTDSDSVEILENLGAPTVHQTFNDKKYADSSEESEIIKLDNNWRQVDVVKNDMTLPVIEDTKKPDIEPVYEEAEIDPVILQYMEMIRQKKEEDQRTQKDAFVTAVQTTDLDNEFSDDIKTESQYSADGLSDKKQHSEKSESDSFW